MWSPWLAAEHWLSFPAFYLFSGRKPSPTSSQRSKLNDEVRSFCSMLLSNVSAVKVKELPSDDLVRVIHRAVELMGWGTMLPSSARADLRLDTPMAVLRAVARHTGVPLGFDPQALAQEAVEGRPATALHESILSGSMHTLFPFHGNGAPWLMRRVGAAPQPAGSRLPQGLRGSSSWPRAGCRRWRRTSPEGDTGLPRGSRASSPSCSAGERGRDISGRAGWGSREAVGLALARAPAAGLHPLPTHTHAHAPCGPSG